MDHLGTLLKYKDLLPKSNSDKQLYQKLNLEWQEISDIIIF